MNRSNALALLGLGSLVAVGPVVERAIEPAELRIRGNRLHETPWQPAPYQLVYYKRYFLLNVYPGELYPHLATAEVVKVRDIRFGDYVRSRDERARQNLHDYLAYGRRSENTVRYRDFDQLPAAYVA